MAFNRVTEIVSAAASRVTSSHPPSGASVASGMFLSESHGHGSGSGIPGQRNHLRFSSSLQDFSAYRGLDPEVGDVDLGIDRSANHALLDRSLERANGSSSFSKEKSPHGIPFIWKKCVRATTCVICLILLFFLIFVCVRYFNPRWSQQASGFYVVLDCGSTGTRVYVYESSIDDKKDGTLPIVLRSLPKGIQGDSNSRSGRAYHRMETEPGFDKLVHNISGLRTAIRPLLRWAEEKIPKRSHKSTSLFLYATAGVRRLPQPDSKWLLNSAWSILKNSSFTCRREWVKTISGMEEAYYGWVALNYHMGRLRSVPAEATFGALDLGGSSLQVTFETQKFVPDETSLNLSIGAINHHLNAYSLSGYGLNDAFDKSVVYLLKSRHVTTNEDDFKIELKHPCLQAGYKEKYFCSQCSLLNQEGGSPLIGEGNKGKGGKPGVSVKLLGMPKWEECSALAKITVNLSEWSNLNPGIDCEIQPCALRASMPRPHGQFFAMSGFYVVYKFFNLTSEATLDDVLLKGQEFCEKPWEVAKNSVVPQPFIEQYCFRAPYIVSLLREGLHITDGQVVIGSGSITWTLGVALMEAGGSLSSGRDLRYYTIFQLKVKPAVLFAMVFISLTLLLCVLSCVGNWTPRFFRRFYIHLFRRSNAASASGLNIPSPFKFQRWSPINSGDGRTKLPLSPTIAGSQQRPFSMGHGLGGSSIQLMESSFSQSSGVSHSYSSGSLGQMQFESNGVGSTWTPHRGQMRLQSRRSQSREDLNSSVVETQLGMV